MVDDYKAGRAEAPDILRQQMGLVRQVVETLRIPMRRAGRLRGRRHHRHPGHRGPRPGRRRHHRHRRPRHLPAGRGPARQGALQPAGRVRLRPLRRGRASRSAPACTPDPLPAVRRAAGRPVRQPARRARRGREDRGQADQHLRRPRRHLRPPRRADAQAAPEPGRRPRPQRRARTPSSRRSSATCRSTSTSTTCVMGGWDIEEVRAAVRLPRVPHALGPPGSRRSAERTAAERRRPRRRVLEVEVDRARPAPPRPSSCSTGLAAAATGAGRWPRRGTGGDGPVAPRLGAGAASATPATADVVVVARRRPARRRRRCAPPWPRWSARRGRPLAAHDAKALMRGLLDDGHRRFPPRTSTPPSPPTWSTRPETSTCSRTWPCATPASSCARPTPRPPGQLDLGGDGVPTGAEEAGRRAAAVARLRRAARRRPRRPGLRALYDDDRAAARPGAGPDGGRRRPGRRRTSCARLTDAAGRRGPPARARDPGRWPASSSSSTRRRSCGTILFDKLGLAPQKKTKTGFSTDAQSLEKLRGRAPDHRATCCATGRSRSCGRPTARRCWPRWRPTGASTPRSTRPWPAPAGCQLRPAQPAQHPGPQRGGPALPAGFVPADGCRFLVADYNQIELRVHRPPGRGPGPDRGLPDRDRHPQRRPRPGSSASSPAEVTIASGPRPRWSPTAWPTAWRPTGWPSGWPSRSTRRPSILDAYFEAFPTVRAYMDRVVAEAREPGLHRDPVRPAPPDPRAGVVATTGSARPASARP